jgi:hypothetical protein
MGMFIKYIHHPHSFAIATVDDGLHDDEMRMLAGVDVGGKGPIKIWTLSKDPV